jgi:hypothetical protein
MRPINHLRNSMYIARNSSENNDPCGTTQTLPFHLSPEAGEERMSTASRTNRTVMISISYGIITSALPAYFKRIF